MKPSTITQVAGFIVLAMITVSCHTTRNSPARPYPEPVDNRPPVRVVERRSSLPPGQAKKIYGERSAREFAPGQQKKHPAVALIIIRTPDIIISRYYNGRYYYKSNQGYYYWQEADGRLYLDEKHLNQITYDEQEFKEWKGKGKKDKDKDKDDDDDDKDNGKNKDRGNGNGNGNGNGRNNGNGNGRWKDKG